MIKAICSKCTEPLGRPGALAFSPPNAIEQVFKYHICIDCWCDFVLWILKQPRKGQTHGKNKTKAGQSQKTKSKISPTKSGTTKKESKYAN